MKIYVLRNHIEGVLAKRLPKVSVMAEPNRRNAKAPLMQGFRLNLNGRPGSRTLEMLSTSDGFQDRYATARRPWPLNVH